MNKEKVLELRETGLSYGEISKLLDMPRSSVISIVKRSQEPKCQWCGKRLHQKPGYHRLKIFCSDACRLKSWKANHPTK